MKENSTLIYLKRLYLLGDLGIEVSDNELDIFNTIIYHKTILDNSKKIITSNKNKIYLDINKEKFIGEQVLSDNRFIYCPTMFNHKYSTEIIKLLLSVDITQKLGLTNKLVWQYCKSTYL